MVTTRDRRGSSTTGCLFSLVLFGVVAYYGVNIGEVFWRYYQLCDAMQSQANLAPGLTDQVIQRRLEESADQILGGQAALRFSVKRGGRPPKITIDAAYPDSVSLPLFKRTFQFKPHAEAPL